MITGARARNSRSSAPSERSSANHRQSIGSSSSPQARAGRTLIASIVKEDQMNKLSILAGIAAIAAASPVFASHLPGNTTPFPTRGACESFTASGIPDDRPLLLEAFPDFFASEGELASFLTRAWTCELGADGQWYVGDHRWDVLNSDWYQRRQ
jgi:hypothetical protein